MAVVTKSADPSARIYGRETVFDSSADFSAGDIVDIEYSIGGSAQNVVVECGAGAACTFRVNSMTRRYPLLPHAKRYNFPAPDFENEAQVINTDGTIYTLSAGQTATITDPVANIQFLTVTDTVYVRVRS